MQRVNQGIRSIDSVFNIPLEKNFSTLCKTEPRWLQECCNITQVIRKLITQAVFIFSSALCLNPMIGTYQNQVKLKRRVQRLLLASV